jgi:hypothetical protein
MNQLRRSGRLGLLAARAGYAAAAAAPHGRRGGAVHPAGAAHRPGPDHDYSTPSGGGGDHTATSLRPSATWQAGTEPGTRLAIGSPRQAGRAGAEYHSEVRME